MKKSVQVLTGKNSQQNEYGTEFSIEFSVVFYY